MQSLVVWWAVVSAAAAIAGACSSSISKRPARPTRPGPAAPGPPPRPAPAPRANITFPTFKCEPDYSEYYCLNGGECFAVVISDSPIYNCECRSGFVGQRCEFKDLDDSYVLTSRRLMMETASIAGGATVAVFLAILVCFGAWVRLHRRGKEPPLEEHGHVQLVAVASGTRGQVALCKAPFVPIASAAGDRPGNPLRHPLGQTRSCPPSAPPAAYGDH